MAKFRLYKDSVGEYRWRLRSANNKSIADSGEGYKSKQGAQEGIEFVKKYAAGAEIEDLTLEELISRILRKEGFPWPRK